MAGALDLCLQRMREVLSFDDDFGQQCRTPLDLCQLLADGETLCCILSVISGGRISSDGDSTVSFYSENSQLLARRNVKFFLTKCVEHFGIKREALFEPDDLLELRDPDRVLAGLQVLLRLPYEQANIRHRSSMADYAELEQAGVVQNVVGEICKCEMQLADKLVTLLRFRQELRSLLSEWSTDLVETTFQYIEDLLRVHEHFYSQLFSLAEEGAAKFCSGLGGLFSDIRPKLSIYAKYYSHYPLAKARLEEEFSANPRLRHQVQLLEGHFKVESFNLLYDAPLRQVFNYSMLFERLLSTASKELPDTTRSVEAALTECKQLLKHFNECKRSSEKAAATQLLLQKVARLPAQLAQLDEVGLHWADGLLRVKKDQEPARDCFCLLTDRQVIVAKAARGASKCAAMDFLFNVPITEDLVLEYSSATRAFKVQQASVGTVLFNRLPDSRKAMDVETWGQLLTRAKSMNFPDGWRSNGHCFRRQSFPSDSACTRCSTTLTGHVFQGYYCEHCRMQLDRECLQIVVRLRPMSYPLAAQRRGPADCEFFHGDLDRGAAERLLRQQSADAGCFLVRESARTAPTTLVLSIQWRQDSVFHLIVHQREDGSLGSPDYSVDTCNVWHPSLDALVTYYRTNKLKIRGVPGVTLGEGVPQAHVYMNA